MNRDLVHAVVATMLSLVGIVILAQIGNAVPFVASNLGALVAVLFLFLPHWFAARRGEDLVDYAFVAAPIGRGLAFFAGYTAVVVPLFSIGFVIFYDTICADGSRFALLAPEGLCIRWQSWEGAHWPALDLAFLELAFVQLVVIALPEELFFRGFIHRLCERALPPRRRILGGGVGWALLLSSFLFAVGHLAVTFDLRRLSVFFPGLVFGWMRSATGSILAGTLAHALSNLLIHILQRVFA